MKKLEKAVKRLNIKFMVDKIYARIASLVEQDFSEEKKKAVMDKMKVFFGPSR